MTERPPDNTMQLLIRSSEGAVTERVSTFQFRTGPLSDLASSESTEKGESGEETFARYSKDGSLVAVITDKAINIYNSSEEKLVQTIPRAGIDEVYFSPLATFLVSFGHKVPKGKETLHVWNTKTGEHVRGFHLKEKDPERWPPLRWSEDEEIMSQLNNNQMNFFDGKDPTKNIGKLHVKNMSNAMMSEQGHAVACFTPDKAGSPAAAMIYEIAKDGEKLTVSETPTAAKSFYRATAAKFAWNPMGSAVLINATTDVDKTGESYYGESQLHLLYTDSQCLTVPFGNNKGPVHDAKWSPQGKDFLVIQGFQPAKITLFNAANCSPVRDFGNASRNTIIFSPHGRFLCIGGFGNLAGEMDFWEKNKFKKMGTCQDIHGASSFEWTPDSRNFITSALFPRRRVDEGFKVWTYYGELVYAQKIPKLTQVAIRPALPGVFENRPMSPRLMDKKLSKEIAQKMEAAKPKAYVPPFLRGKGSAAASNKIKESKDGSGPRKLAQMGANANLNAQAAAAAKTDKNKKRRERQKAKKAEEEEAAAAKEKAEAEAKALVRAKEEEERQKSLAALGDDELLKKKLKKLQKQERQIVKLKETSESGGTLDAGQKQKLAGLPAILKEIKEIEAKLAAL